MKHTFAFVADAREEPHLTIEFVKEKLLQAMSGAVLDIEPLIASKANPDGVCKFVFRQGAGMDDDKAAYKLAVTVDLIWPGQEIEEQKAPGAPVHLAQNGEYEALKSKALGLGIEFSGNISKVKLMQLIAEKETAE